MMHAELLPTTIETWLLAPIAAPDFSLPDLDGRTRTLSALRGKRLLLTFWIKDSPDCDRDLALLNQMHRRRADQDPQLLAVNLDNAGELKNILALVRTRGLTLPIVQATNDVGAIYNLLYRHLFERHRDLTLPTSFLIDGQGDIVKVYQGPLNEDHLEDDCRHIPLTPAERMAKGLPFSGLSDSPDFRRNYLSYGSVYFLHGYFDQAGAAFQLALHNDPSSSEALYGLGSVYLKQNKNAEARDAFERATQLKASYPETLPNAWNNLGLLAAHEGRVAEAIPFFQRALQLDPDHLVALENLGSAYRQQKQWADAKKTLQHALALKPDDAEANYSLGMVYAQLDDSNKAYEYFQNALRSRPDYPEALNNLGVLYLRTRRRDQAVASFEECIRVAPQFDQSYLNLARVYALEGTPGKARDVLLELLKQHPQHSLAQQMLAQLPH